MLLQGNEPSVAERPMHQTTVIPVIPTRLHQRIRLQTVLLSLGALATFAYGLPRALQVAEEPVAIVLAAVLILALAANAVVYFYREQFERGSVCLVLGDGRKARLAMACAPTDPCVGSHEGPICLRFRHESLVLDESSTLDGTERCPDQAGIFDIISAKDWKRVLSQSRATHVKSHNTH